MEAGTATYSTIVSFVGISEPVSSISHIVGAGVAAMAGWGLVRRGRGSWIRVGSLSVFVGSAVTLLLASGLYHLATPEGAPRVLLQKVDHAAIFALIAGTFTPVHAILLRRGWRWGMLAVLWLVTLLGMALTTVYFRELSEGGALVLYLGLGWLGLITMLRLAWERGLRFALPILAGGVAYSIGAVLEFYRWPVVIPGVIGPHEVLHFAVISGLALHWRFIHGWAQFAVD